MKNSQKLFVGLCAAAFVGLFSAGLRAEDKIAPGTMDFLAATTISGYVDVTYATDLQSGSNTRQGMSANGFSGSSGFGSVGGIGPRNNDFTLNQFKLTFEKPLDKSDWAAGYRVDLVGGADAGFIDPGFNLDDVGFEHSNSITLAQAYINVRFPVGTGIGMKAGVFYGPFGNEVFESPSNYNVTRSFLYMFAQPRTLTGVELSYTWELPGGVTMDTMFGVANGWGWTSVGLVNGVDDQNSGKTVFGQARVTFWDGKASIATGGIYGPEQTVNTQSTRWMWDTVATVKPMDKLTISLDGEYGQETGRGLGFELNKFWGLSGIVNYVWNDWLDTSLRGEFFSDRSDDETFTRHSDGGAGFNALNPQSNDLWAVTGTANFKIWKNVLSRVELRYAASSDGFFPKHDDSFSTAQFQLIAELAYMF